MNKSEARLRRAKKTRLVIKRLAVHRLTVHRTPRHIYAQVLSPSGAEVLVSASSLDKAFASKKDKLNGVEIATKVGKLIAKRAKESGIVQLAFDRSGFKYHGRVKALAEAARSDGLEF